MSRSYKKTPVSTMKSKVGKSQSNRKVRQWNKVQRQFYEDLDGARRGKHEVISNGRKYRNVYNRYDVCEIRSYYPKDKWIGKLAARRRLEEDGGKLYNWNTSLKDEDWERFYRRK